MTDRQVAALTFDDGPHPIYTPLILEILDKYEAKATFFVVGEAAARHPEILSQIQEAGHALGNHSWDHPSFIEISASERRKQVWKWEESVGVQPVKLFRPPHGHQTNRTSVEVWRLGYQRVGWSTAVQDWLPVTVEDVEERLYQQIKPGVIVLLHDAIYKSRLKEPQFDRSNLVTGLSKALVRLQTSYKFVTVPDLLKYGRPRKLIWKMTDKG